MTDVTSNRKNYIGGSDMPYILGLAEAKGYGTLFDFTKVKLGLQESAFDGNEYTRYGQLIEPLIRDFVNQDQGWNYQEDKREDNKAMFRSHVDGFDKVAEYPLIEIKTYGKSGFDRDYYIPQCLFYMAQFGVDKCVLLAYERPEDFYMGVDYELESSDDYFTIEFDKERLSQEVIELDDEKWQPILDKIEHYQLACKELLDMPNMTKEAFDSMIIGDSKNELDNVFNELVSLEQELVSYKEIQTKHKEAKDKLYKIFEAINLKKHETDHMLVTRVLPVEKITKELDVETLQKEFPDDYKSACHMVAVFNEDQFKTANSELYERLQEEKISKRVGYLRVTLRKPKEDKPRKVNLKEIK